MHTLYDIFCSPFVEFSFMRRALVSCFALSLSTSPIGLFLVMRRMSLMGDAMSHAVLPGVALGFILAGLSVPAMSLGGFLVGILVALLSGLATQLTSIKEDANFTGFYLLSLAIGVILVSSGGSNIDLMHILFGSVLAVDNVALILVASVSSITLIILAFSYRPLLLESLDPLYLSALGVRGKAWHMVFLMLVVLNLVAGFQALGTLMAVGLMMLPAITARLWSDRLEVLFLLAMGIAFLSGFGGLLLSYYLEFPSGPAIILLAGLAYVCSLLVAPVGGALPRYIRRRHFIG